MQTNIGTISHEVEIGLKQALKSIATSGYFTYQGSLTKPPCIEGLKWTVFKTPVPIGLKQVVSVVEVTLVVDVAIIVVVEGTMATQY